MGLPERPFEQPYVRLTLHEGCFHQVKRMIGACSGNVVGLHRATVGPLQLTELNLPRGTARAPTADELDQILSMLPSSCRVAKAQPAAVTRAAERASSGARYRSARRATAAVATLET